MFAVIVPPICCYCCCLLLFFYIKLFFSFFPFFYVKLFSKVVNHICFYITEDKSKGLRVKAGQMGDPSRQKCGRKTILWNKISSVSLCSLITERVVKRLLLKEVFAKVIFFPLDSVLEFLNMVLAWHSLPTLILRCWHTFAGTLLILLDPLKIILRFFFKKTRMAHHG